MKEGNVKSIWKVICFMFVFLALTDLSTAGTYDFVLKDPGTKKLQEVYNNQVRKERVIMNYLNLLVDSPQTLVKILERDGCEKEILDFTRKNPELVLAIVHVSIIQALSKSNVDDNQLMYVTGVIEDPKAQAAKNGAEYQMEKEYLRQMYPAYAMYEVATARGGLKDMVEAFFHGMKKSQKKKAK